MKFIRLFILTFIGVCLSGSLALAQSPVQKHGKLRISGKHIVDKNGAVTSLAGPSFFWSNTGWGQDRFYTRGAVETFARDWKAGIVRVAVGAQNDGSILKDRRGNLTRAQTVIEAAIDNGLYVIVDWHSHQAERDTKDAKAFFTHIAKRYGHTPNIIYEIYNEPLDTTDWKRTVKPYAKELIKTIRAIDPDNLIIVGTQSWAQDVDKAADSPIHGQKNILYSLHFYAATHKEHLREKAEYAINKGLPIIISEWGSVTYSGDGYIDIDSAIEWMKFAKKHKLSHLNWSVSDKDENASMLKAGASSNGGWTTEDLTISGQLAREIMRNW
jgi:aryl-phospho-beta-D-glucosidase BglC (GH1 family)